MKMRKFPSKELLGLSLAGILTGFAGSAMASGFQLFEENGVGSGDYNAGAAASANDASTTYYNPAGLVRLDCPQIVLSADNIFTNIDFHGSNTWNTSFPTPLTPVLPPSTASGTSQGGSYALVPALFYAAPINSNVFFGFGITVPFGLDTDYATTSITNYTATKSEVNDLDFSPALAIKFTDQFSFGAGVDFERFNAQLDSVAGLPSEAALSGLPSDAFNTQSVNKAADWGTGAHAGILYQFTPTTRVGLTYHSQVAFHLTGTSVLTGGLASAPAPIPFGNNQLSSNNLNSSITMPASTTLSAFHNINSQWAVEGSVNYTQWDVLKNVNLASVAATSPEFLGTTVIFAPSNILVNIPENFRNTWRAAVGATYQLCPAWLFRAGFGYDENPTNNTDRNLRLPDGNSWATAIGAHYQASDTVGLDLGWTHLFFPNASINNNAILGSQVVTTVGTVKGSADILGTQLTWDIA